MGAWAGAAEPEGIAGRVLDKTGAGMASAKVWVVGGSWEEPETVAEATADGQGAFPFPRFWEEQALEGVLKRITHSFSLVARDGGGRIGRLTSLSRTSTAPIKIELVETGEARGARGRYDRQAGRRGRGRPLGLQPLMRRSFAR